MNKYLSFAILSFTIAFSSLVAQNTYSPYSSLGLGEIYSGDRSHMGGMGIGIHNSEWLNSKNPAGVAAIDSMAGIFEVGIFAKGSVFQNSSRSDKSFTANFDKIAFGFRGKKWWSVALGIKPYSSVGYRINTVMPVEGGAEQSLSYDGSGGLYNLYASNAFSLGYNTFLGVTSSLIAGELIHEYNVDAYTYRTNSRTTQFYNKLGIQHRLSSLLTLGATYGYRQKVVLKNTQRILSNSSNSTIISEERKRNNSYFIPESYGVGFSYKTPKLLLAGEYELEKWNNENTTASNITLGNAHKIFLGATYHDIREVYTMHLAKQYQMGVSLQKSNIQVSGKSAWNYTLSSGIVIPLRANQNQRALLNIGLEYGSNLSAPRGYLKDNYLLLSVNFSLIEAMFMRSKIF